MRLHCIANQSLNAMMLLCRHSIKRDLLQISTDGTVYTALISCFPTVFKSETRGHIWLKLKVKDPINAAPMMASDGAMPNPNWPQS
jgi:hypothetical protein